MAKNIGDQNIKIDKTHPSINAINEKYSNAAKSHQLILKPIGLIFSDNVIFSMWHNFALKKQTDRQALININKIFAYSYLTVKFCNADSL